MSVDPCTDAPTSEVVATAASLRDLSLFEFDRVLSDSPHSRSVAVLGRLRGYEGRAILLAARRHLAPHVETLCSGDLSLTPVFDNDVYYKFEGLFGPATPAANLMDVQLIHPCTDKHIAKHTAQRFRVVRESPALYAAAVRPHVESIPASQTEWVRNVINKTKEADRLIAEDTDEETGFVLHPDLKYNGVSPDDLYCVAIVRRGDLGSIRDLDASHVPLLANLRDKCAAAIEAKYGVPAHLLRVYFHYYPSYYHLHVHFVHVSNDAFMGSAAAGRAHLLDDVIQNLLIAGDYYRRATITAVIGENNPVFKAIEPHLDGN